MNLLKFGTISNDFSWEDILGAKRFLGQDKTAVVEIAKQTNAWGSHFDILGAKEEYTIAKNGCTFLKNQQY